MAARQLDKSILPQVKQEEAILSVPDVKEASAIVGEDQTINLDKPVSQEDIVVIPVTSNTDVPYVSVSASSEIPSSSVGETSHDP